MSLKKYNSRPVFKPECMNLTLLHSTKQNALIVNQNLRLQPILCVLLEVRPVHLFIALCGQRASCLGNYYT